MNSKILSEYAQEVEFGDPIDWGMFPLKESDTYDYFAAMVLEIYNGFKHEDREVISLAIITKLLVENMVLHYEISKFTC